MDFKKILNTLDSMEAPVSTPAAPTLPKSVQLNEDAELRVLAGQSTVLAEAAIMEKAVSKAQQQAAGAALAAKRGEGKAVGASKEMMKMSTKELEKIAGTKHKGLPEKKTEESIEEAAIDDYLDRKKAEKGEKKDDTGSRKVAGTRYGGSAQKDDADEGETTAKKGRKAAKESVDLDIEEFNETFSQMVEASKSKPDFLDIDKDGNKKEPMKKAAADKKKGTVKEAAKPDFLDLDKDGNKKEPMKKAAADKKKGTVKEASDDRAPAKKSERQATLPSGAKVKATKVQGWQSQKADKSAEKNESKMMPKGKKRPVKESVEPKLSFKQMVQLVQESGGQQQIDAKDEVLFAWAQRVAKNKLGEGMKAEVYAGLVYERMGGRFEMYDVLSEGSETQLDENFEINEEEKMTIMVGNTGFGQKFQPTDVYSTELKLVNGQPILFFALKPGQPAEFQAQFKNGHWMADMD